ncbi:porin [Ensifer sp. ENS07]|uniref:porin n=1 Tax=Ensifer sp. ENS07 TaxID=2769274 RepID=UPI001780E84F|nr:porin [Ensifer sp. ENS07]MBD9640514.1 porin [Ensifer sp. ENS07]
MRQTLYIAPPLLFIAALATAGSAAAQEPPKPAARPVEVSKAPEHWLPKLRLGDDNAYLEFYGQINKGLLIYDDGGTTENYFPVDNGNSSSRAGFRIYTLMEKGWSFGANLEWEWNPYSTTNVNQLNEDHFDWGTDLLRKAEIYLDSKDYGRFWFGQGSMASDATAEVDLSGTTVVGYSLVSDMAGGPFFRNDDGTLSTVRVKDAFTNYDGLSRKFRVRYDTPSFGGFSFATSVGTQVVPEETDVTVWDMAVRYDETYDAFKVGGAIAFSRPGDGNSIYDASVSVLHLDTGLSLTLAAGYSDKETVDGRYGYVKVGYQADIFDVGKTAFSVDAYFGKDIAGMGSKSDSFGAQVVQNLDYLQTELYLGARTHSLEQRTADLQDSFAVLGGARIKF